MSGDHRDLMSAESSGEPPLEAMLPRRKIIVAVGIDAYRCMPALRCAVNDACGVQELLVNHFGFEAPIPPLTNDAATKAAIEALVEDQLRELLTEDDALILFFAGHGATRVDPLDGATVETGYLVPADARGAEVFGDLVNIEALLSKIGLLPAHHILVVLDACHSGVALGSGVSRHRAAGSYVHRLSAQRSRRVITSAGRGEPALEGGPVPGRSLFTGTLMHALTSGQADLDGNGVITSSELALFLQQQVGRSSGGQQTPDDGAFHLDDRGELVLAMRDGARGYPAPWAPPQAHAHANAHAYAPAGPRPSPAPGRSFLVPAVIAGSTLLAATFAAGIFLVNRSPPSGGGVALPTAGDDVDPQKQAEPPTVITPGGATPAAAKPPTISSVTTGGWTEITSKLGRFTVQMPGKITTLGNHSSSDSGLVSFGVAYTDNPAVANSADFAELLDNSRDMKIAGGATLLSERSIKAGAYPGRELVFDHTNLVMSYERHIVAGQRWYVLTVMVRTFHGAKADPAAIERFFTSFEIEP